MKLHVCSRRHIDAAEDASEMSLVTVASVIFYMKSYFLSFQFIWLLDCFLGHRVLLYSPDWLQTCDSPPASVS